MSCGNYIFEISLPKPPLVRAPDGYTYAMEGSGQRFGELVFKCYLPGGVLAKVVHLVAAELLEVSIEDPLGRPSPHEYTIRPSGKQKILLLCN